MEAAIRESGILVLFGLIAGGPPGRRFQIVKSLLTRPLFAGIAGVAGFTRFDSRRNPESEILPFWRPRRRLYKLPSAHAPRIMSPSSFSSRPFHWSVAAILAFRSETQSRESARSVASSAEFAQSIHHSKVGRKHQ